VKHYPVFYTVFKFTPSEAGAEAGFLRGRLKGPWLWPSWSNPLKNKKELLCTAVMKTQVCFSRESSSAFLTQH